VTRSTGGKTDRLLSIGEFSRRSRLSPKALRMYDRRGLLVPAEVDEANGYRRYRESQLETARLVVLLRRLDMPLALIEMIVGLGKQDAIEVIGYWWEAIEKRIAEQRSLVTYLQQRLQGETRNDDMYDIKVREVEEQRVLTEKRVMTVEGLSDFIGGTLGTFFSEAESFGGVTAPTLVIFHGAVTEDNAAPVEVCAPVRHDAQVPEHLATRIEPAHREAYTRIRKSQVEFPQILDAYDAVDAWIQQNQETCTDSPREVYFADFMNAGPDDEVVDIAFPIK